MIELFEVQNFLQSASFLFEDEKILVVRTSRLRAA
jgi:hypothetical protein